MSAASVADGVYASADLAAAPQLNVVCPAGSAIAETPGGPACRCWVEKETITARESPTSLSEFCCSAYAKCPSWQAEKQRLEEAKSNAFKKRPLVVDGA